MTGVQTCALPILAFAKYKKAGFTAEEFVDLYANQSLFTQVEQYFSMFGRETININAVKSHKVLMLTDSDYSIYNQQQQYNPSIVNALTEIQTVVIPDNPINNILQYLQNFNFDNASSYKVTIAAIQPKTGSRAKFAVGNQTGILAAVRALVGGPNKVSVGHTFLILEQQKADGTKITRTLGFYPNANASPKSASAPFIFGNDSNKQYDIGITYDVNPTNFINLVNNIVVTSANYDLNTNNCTGFAIGQIERINITLPKTMGTWPLGGNGLNPADFGEDLRPLTGVKNYYNMNTAPLNRN